MKDMRKLDIAILFVGLVSLAVGVIGKLLGSFIAGLTPRGYLEFTAICFLLSINLQLLDKKS
jgi:uncharacterized membrane protein YfcA